MSQSPKSSVKDGLQQSLHAEKSKSFIAEEKYRMLIESLKDYGIFMLDKDGFIQTWNPGAERIKGFTAEEAIGQHFSLFYTQEDIQRNHPQWELEQAILLGRYEEEGWRIKKDGTKLWANVIITPLIEKNGELSGFAKVTRDLTEKKLAEEDLKKSERLSRRMFEGVKDYALITLDPEGKVATWNEGARRIKGYESQEIIGKYFAAFYPETDIQMGKCEYELREAKETGRFEDEGWRLRKDGTKFWASVLITAIRGDKGELMGFSKVTRDMTERKRSEDLLRMAYANLEKRVEERTKQLTDINSKLQEAVSVRDEFLSIASHELRTPLTPLRLQVQGLVNSIRKGTLKTLPDDRLGRLAETCDKSVSRLANLIDNLLDVSRINTGKFNLSLDMVNLTELVEDVLVRHYKEIEDSGSLISFHSDKEVEGRWDHMRIEQVVINVMMNALKYGNGKAIAITIHEENDWAILKVQDHGLGIELKDQSRIFERFERVDHNKNIGGLGLGLFITYQMVHAHHGTIEVESTLGIGSLFTVRLPIHFKESL